MKNNPSLTSIAAAFFKLGCIGFGGPAAHIALMQQEFVEKRKWLNNSEFLDLLGATHLIPGPNSTEMAIHIGYEKGGWKGLILAGLCFIIPAVVITAIIAILYKNYGQLPEIKPYIYGAKPAIIAIIIAAIIPLAKKSLHSKSLIIIGCLVFVGAVVNISEIYLMFGSGLLAILWFMLRKKWHTINSFFPLVLIPLISSNTTLTNTQLFSIFFKIGAVLYGSGYALFAFLDTELVSKGVLSKLELMDAIAVGQFTPGPVFSSATFIGYQINGGEGALVATAALFLPSFVLVALLIPIVKKLRKSPLFSSFLDAVNVASVALIIAVCLEMGVETITDWKSSLIGILSILVALKFKKINSAFIIVGSAFLGYLLSTYF